MPPGYLRFAGHDDPVFDDETGTVVVTNPDGETVLERSYGTEGTDPTAGETTDGTG